MHRPRSTEEATMTATADHIWGRPRPIPDRCSGIHTYAGGCVYNADDPHRPMYPAELRPGIRSEAA
ncbi:hypothetical protein GPOL_c29120 [Gordonia polyisoprenivorans VH2]|uniref:Uncharacterized protein n=2 Tax=Gordoniaceae TaxID=85026 RepID=H6MTQ4_GORPV|nr:hypothetical protein GPOL_c29120 [Gordonia polyisoprenivorans VH2]HCS59072.1 hypothetical protein [Gordonia polyisoprenivorans]